MQLEFLNLLEKVLIEHMDRNICEHNDSDLIVKSMKSPACDLSQVRVQLTPKVIEAPFTCNIAFILSSIYNKTFEQLNFHETSPKKFAEYICALWDGAGQSEYFQLQYSSSGHINIQPTDKTEQKFLHVIDSLTSDQFFQSAFDGSSLFGGASGVSITQSCKGLFDLSLCPLQENFESVDVDDRYSRYLQPFPLGLLEQKKKTNLEISRLLSGVEMAEYPQRDIHIMLLALLADDELDADPFLSGEWSRQNVPWYLNRFSKDCSRWLSKAKSHFGSNISFDFSANEPLDPAILCIHNEVLTLRFFFRQAFETHRPDLLIKKAIEIMRSFYRVYNRPDVRDAQYFAKQPTASYAFYFMMHVASRLVWFLLGLTNAICIANSHDFALKHID